MPHVHELRSWVFIDKLVAVWGHITRILSNFWVQFSLLNEPLVNLSALGSAQRDERLIHALNRMSLGFELRPFMSLLRRFFYWFSLRFNRVALVFLSIRWRRGFFGFRSIVQMLKMNSATQYPHILVEHLVVHIEEVLLSELFLNVKAPFWRFFVCGAYFLDLLNFRLVYIFELILKVREEEDVSFVASSSCWWVMLVAVVHSCRIDMREDVNVFKHAQLLQIGQWLDFLLVRLLAVAWTRSAHR